MPPTNYPSRAMSLAPGVSMSLPPHVLEQLPRTFSRQLSSQIKAGAGNIELESLLHQQGGRTPYSDSGRIRASYGNISE